MAKRSTEIALQQPVQLIGVDEHANLTLPAGSDFLRAEFTRAGPDLLIETPDTNLGGDQYVVPAFFMSETPPDLITHDGAVLSAQLLTTLAGPMAPGQVAQLGQNAAVNIGFGQPIGHVSEAEGNVTVTHPDGSQGVLITGDKVFQGDVLATATGANVSLIFVDDTVFSLDEDGRMVMDEMVYDPDTQTGAFNATVVQGVFSFVSGQVAKTSLDGMVVNTPTSTIGIRGSTVAGNAAAEGAENKITLIPDVDGNVGEIVISNGAGSLTLNSAGASTTVFSSTSSPTPIVILSPAELQQSFGQNLTKLIQTVSKKATQDASQAQDKAQQTQQEAKQAEVDAKQAEEEAQAAEAEAQAAEAEAEAAQAEAETAKAEAEASGDEVAIAKAAAAEAKAAEAVQKAAEAKAAAEAEAQVAAKATAEAEAKAGEAEVAQAKAEQAQKFSSLANTAFKAQAQAFEQNKQTEAAKADKAAKADTTTGKDDAGKTGDGETKGQPSDDAATKAAADAATKAAAEAAAKAAADAEAAAKAAAEAAAKTAAEAAAKAAALAAAAAAEAEAAAAEADTTTTTTTSTTTSFSYATHANAITVTLNGSTATVTDGYGKNDTLTDVKSLTGTSYNDTFTLSGVTLDKLSVGSGTDTITVDSATRITNLSNRPAHENTLQTLGTDGTAGDMDLRGTTVSGDFYISLNTQGNSDNSTILHVDSSTSFTSGTTTIAFGQNSYARNIESDDGMNLSGVSISGASEIILDSSSDTVGATLTVSSTSSFSSIAITGSGDDKIVFSDSGTFSFHDNVVTGISTITFNGAGTNSLQVNQADLASVTTITGNTGSDTITTADSSIDLSAITLTSIDLITTTNTSRTTFKGSNGDDIITGGSGSDVIAGGVGSDTLTGGSGGDVFAYQSLTNAGVDAWMDYSVANGDRFFIEKTLIGNHDATIDANEWFNLGTKADDASIQAAINAQSHAVGAMFATFNTSTGHAEAWYDVTDHTTTGDANKVGYINSYSESVSNAVANGSSMGIILADTTNLSTLNNAG